MRPIASGDVDNRGESTFTVIVAVAKRARLILEGSPTVIKPESTKPVTIAIEEWNADRIHWIRTKEGIK